MKKISILFLTLTISALFLSFPASASEAIASEPEKDVEITDSIPEEPAEEIASTEAESSIIMALNNHIITVGGATSETSAPLFVFGKTYVDLYALSPLLSVDVAWVEDGISFFRATKDEQVVDFTLISQWDALINQPHKFFVKDTKVYVSLRELADLAKADITYKDGLITIGPQSGGYFPDVYSSIDLTTSDDYVYMTYPRPAEYVVYPYQAYNHSTMMSDAKRLENMYPELIKTSSIGASVEGRDLLLIEFGRGDTKIFVCGTHHAREYIATTYIMYAIDRYAYAYRTNSLWGKYNPRAILDNVTFCIVPMVNPDGVNLVQNGIYATTNAVELANMKIYDGARYGYSAWKANVRGVDVNWNYDKDWSKEKEKNPRGSTGFNGDRPGTEPETIAVSAYVDSVPFEAYLSFHTQGQIFYWADNPDDPSYLQYAIANDTGFIGYKDAGTGIGGSFFDYVYRKYKKPTVTVELCRHIGSFPYPDSDFDTVWKPAKNILLLVGNEILYKNSLK